MRLTCTSNRRRGSTRDADALVDEVGEPLLVGALDRGELVAEGGVARRRRRARAARRGRRASSSPMRLVISSVKPGLHWTSQRRGVMPLVLLLMRSGYRRCRSANTVFFISSVCSAETPLTQWLPTKGEVAHAHPALARLRRSATAPRIWSSLRPVARASSRTSALIAVDDLQVARQHPLEQRHRPGLQRLGQQGVVGVGEGALVMLPGRVPVHAVLVDQEPHQLGHGDRRVGVVELDRDLVGQRRRGRRTAGDGGGGCPAARPTRRSTPAAGAAPVPPAWSRPGRGRASARRPWSSRRARRCGRPS